MKISEIKSLLISRTDSIGDVVLTLPIAGAIKKKFPQIKILFLGRNYTKDVIALSGFVDEFINWDELSKLKTEDRIVDLQRKKIDCIIHVFPNKEIAKCAFKAAIPLRVGTTNRFFHWIYCNKKISFSRRKSELHEAQLNFKLLDFLGIGIPEKSEIPQYYGFNKPADLPSHLKGLIDPAKINLILHPKSKGSAREWGLKNFNNLISILPKNEVKIFISGTKEDGELMKSMIDINSNVVNVCGKFTLDEFISFINACDVMVAASTGPLHIAAALGKKAIGIFAPMKPIHPGRWAPVGKKACYFVKYKPCNECRLSQDCKCIREINPIDIKSAILAVEVNS